MRKVLKAMEQKIDSFCRLCGFAFDIVEESELCGICVGCKPLHFCSSPPSPLDHDAQGSGAVSLQNDYFEIKGI